MEKRAVSSLDSGPLSSHRVRYKARHEDGWNAWHVAPRQLVRIGVPCLECRLFQSIEDESGLKECTEELVQGAMKIPVRLRLAGHPPSLPGWHHEVVAHFHGVPCDFDPIASGLCLGAKTHGIAIESRVLHRKDEPPSRRQKPPAGPQ
jgi:hypothetical protein